jgi:hypothetical protein
MRFFKPWSEIWPTSILLLVIALVIVAVFKYSTIDTPPPHISKPESPFVIVYHRPERDIIKEQLWLAQCDAYEREPAEYSLLTVDAGGYYGVVMRIDCRGNITWPHGQEIGAMYLAIIVGEMW